VVKEVDKLSPRVHAGMASPDEHRVDVVAKHLQPGD
jgi:hypothetical protein